MVASSSFNAAGNACACPVKRVAQRQVGDVVSATSIGAIGQSTAVASWHRPAVELGSSAVPLHTSRHEEMSMPDPINQPDLHDDDELIPVTRERSRGGHEPPPEVNDRPDQNVAYDEAVKGAPLTPQERARAERESPLSD